MIKAIHNNKLSFFIVFIAVFLLAAIRNFESILFYDPFIVFFKSNYHHEKIPFFDAIRLFFSYLFRYFLNSGISLLIIYFLFKEKQLVKFSFFLLAFFFIILSSVFFGYLYFKDTPDYLFLFYVRRFLIQPLFLLLFIPAFYYQKIQKK